MNKNKTFLIALLVALTMTSAFARGDKRGKMKEIMKQLELTEEQKEKLSSFRKGNNREEMKAMREQRKALREKFNTAFAGDASEATLKSLHAEMGALKAKMKEKRFEKLLKVRSVLTSEQRKKFAELKFKKRGKRGNRD